MGDFTVKIGTPFQGRDRKKLIQFLAEQELDYDENITYSCVLENEGEIIAAGSADKNIIKCVAVSPDFQGQNLLGEIITRLINHFIQQGITHYFGFTKPRNKDVFGNMGLYPVAETEHILLLENRRHGLEQYIKRLQKGTEQMLVELTMNEAGSGIGAVVANCNPFTKGHRYLIETAARDCRLLHVFILADANQRFSESDRFEMVRRGCADLKNVILHRASDYLISPVVFPTYFLKDKAGAYKMNCGLDVKIFGEKIAAGLGINRRYVGTEPTDPVTNEYNSVLQETLPEYGIELHKIERLTVEDNRTVSASVVRKALEERNTSLLHTMLTESTLQYLMERGEYEL